MYTLAVGHALQWKHANGACMASCTVLVCLIKPCAVVGDPGSLAYAAAISHHHRERGYMTGQPVNLAVTAEASLPAPIASAATGGESFRAPEKRIHNQAELDRYVALPQLCPSFPYSNLVRCQVASAAHKLIVRYPG